MKRNHNLTTKLALAAAVITATAFYSCDSGLNLEEYRTASEWGALSFPMTPPDTKGLMGISSVKLMDEENKFLVRAVDGKYSRGTGVGKVGVDAFHDTNRYRIPSATVIPGGEYAGRLLVISDARFGSRADLPAKASTWVRYSDDNGRTWSNIKTVSDFNDTDMSGVQAAMNRMSVSTGDSAIGADSKGNVYSISTFVPPMVGNVFGATSNAVGSPYVWINGEWYLRLRKGDQHTWHENQFTEKNNFTEYGPETLNGNDAAFVYAVSVKGGPIKVLNNNSGSPTLGTDIGYYMDKYYYLYEGTSAGGKQLTSSQIVATSNSQDPDRWGAATVNYTLNKSTKIHQHVFMPMSPFQVWRGSTFLGLTKSSNGGETWDKTIDISYMTNTFYANNKSNANLEKHKCRQYICPTRGFEVENGKYKGQVVFALYMTNGKSSGTATEQASIILTADQGATWTPGTGFAGGNGQTHKGESAVVEAPNGDFILVSRNYRNAGYYPTYAYTKDGGNTWTEKGYAWEGTKDADHPLFSCGNLISVINLRFTKSIRGNPLVAFSTDGAGGIGGSGEYGRQNGKLWIAAIVEDGADGWKFDFSCDLSGGPVGTPYGIPSNWNSAYFHYSSLAETFNGNIFSAYEGAAWSYPAAHGGPVIDYAFFTLNRR